MGGTGKCQHGLDETLLRRFLTRYFYDTKPADIVSLDVDWAVPRGGNFTSRVFRLKWRCLTGSGKKKTVNMIVKAQLLSEGHRELFSAVPVFRTEVKAYTTVLRLMEDLQNEFEDCRESLWPKFFGFEPFSTIALEDLKSLNYSVADRKILLDLNHAVLVLRNIARFHAMSRILLAKNLITKHDFGPLALTARDEIASSWFTAILVRLADAMDTTWGSNWVEIADRLRAQIPVVTNKVADLGEEYDKRFEVFNHGDLWTSNALFRYMECENIPVSVRFVDYQMCHVNSFIWDLEYFIASSVAPPVRRAKKRLLLQEYQLSLEKNLKMFEYNGYIPSLDDVTSESNRVEYAMAILTAQSPITVAATDNAVSTDKIIGHSPAEIIHDTVYSDGKAQLTIGDDLREFVSKGLI